MVYNERFPKKRRPFLFMQAIRIRDKKMKFWQEERLARYYAMRQSKNNVEIYLLTLHSKLFMFFSFYNI